MSASVLKETAVTINPPHPEYDEQGTTSTSVQQPVLSVEQSANPVIASSKVSGSSSVSATDEPVAPEAPTGDPRALLAARLLASFALLVSAFIHAKLAIQLGVGGSLISQGQLFAGTALISVILAMALLTSNKRVWLLAVVLSVSGLGAILASVYSTLPSVGPLPSINEQEWFLTKVIAAFAEASVPVLWLIRQIAPVPALVADEADEADQVVDRSSIDTTSGERKTATA